jgi:AraC-like DNA-binding protein
MMSGWLPSARVEICFADVFVCEPDWSWRSPRLRNPDLWYVIEGIAWIEEAASAAPRAFIGAGDCVLMQKQRSYAAGHDPERPLSLIAVHFEPLDEAGRSVEIDLPEPTPFVQKMEGGSVVRELLTRAVRSHQDGCHRWAGPWLQVVLMEVLRQRGKTWPPGRFGDRARQIERLCERIRNRPGEPVRIDGLAAEMGMSPEHFCRLFRRLQGLPPRTFITRTRIEAAQRLLLTSRHSVERIAGLLGYGSPFQFSRQFKAKTGVPPSAFRASLGSGS